MKTQDTAWGLFSGNLYLPATTRSTKKRVAAEFDVHHLKHKGYSIKKVTVTWEGKGK